MGWSLLKADTSDATPKAKEEDEDTREMRVTVFPQGGGAPYIKDVDVTEEGTFDLHEDRTSYHIAPNSVWQEGGTLRCIVHEANAETVDAYQLNGEDDGINPTTLHALVHNNLLRQLDDIQKRKNAWRQGTTWALVGLAVVALILAFWHIRTTGAGLEAIEEALRQAQFAAENARHEPMG